MRVGNGRQIFVNRHSRQLASRERVGRFSRGIAWDLITSFGRLATSIANRSKCESVDEDTRGISTVAASPRRPLTDVSPSYAPLGECPLDRPYGMPLSRTPSDLWHSHMGFPCGHGAEEVGRQL